MSNCPFMIPDPRDWLVDAAGHVQHCIICRYQAVLSGNGQ